MPSRELEAAIEEWRQRTAAVRLSPDMHPWGFLSAGGSRPYYIVLNAWKWVTFVGMGATRARIMSVYLDAQALFMKDACEVLRTVRLVRVSWRLGAAGTLAERHMAMFMAMSPLVDWVVRKYMPLRMITVKVFVVWHLTVIKRMKQTKKIIVAKPSNMSNSMWDIVGEFAAEPVVYAWESKSGPELTMDVPFGAIGWLPDPSPIVRYGLYDERPRGIMDMPSSMQARVTNSVNGCSTVRRIESNYHRSARGRSFYLLTKWSIWGLRPNPPYPSSWYYVVQHEDAPPIPGAGPFASPQVGTNLLPGDSYYFVPQGIWQ